jgi:dTDP-4-dehydrorhamnose reductase
MKILITGSNGQLGRELAIFCVSKGYEVVGYDHSSLDITNYEKAKRLIHQQNPSIIVNTAAYTNVERAEEEIRSAYSVNSDGPKILAKICKIKDIPLLHISTDFVFDGLNSYSYKELDKTSPLSLYGKSKEKGEENIRNVFDSHIILRTSWMYGYYGNNFVKKIIKLGCERRKLKVVSDQIGNPTSSLNLSNVIIKIIEKLYISQYNWGTYHYCDDMTINRYEYAKLILKIAKNYARIKTENIIPVKSWEFKTDISRPLNSSLNCEKIFSKFNILQYDSMRSLKEFIKVLCGRRQNTTGSPVDE